MKRIALWLMTVFVFGCGGTTVVTIPNPEAGKSQPPTPAPPKPRDEAKEATDEFPEFARKKVDEWQPIFIGNTASYQLSDGATFEYKLANLKLRDTDVRKSDSLVTPIVGEMELEVEWTLEKVTKFPRDFVPASAKSPTKRVKVDCVWKNSWALKSSEDLSKAILTLPR